MTRTFGTIALLLVASAAFAEQPRVQNGQLLPHPLSGSLERAIRDLAQGSPDPAWIGYAVPSARRDNQMCCWSDGHTMTCNLEPGTSTGANVTRSTEPVRLESGDVFFVMFRVDEGQVNRIRMFSEECPLDAGTRTIHWLTGVKATESVSVLTAYAARTERKVGNAALSALAMHADPAALEALVTLARSADAAQVRGEALFWLAQRAGQKAAGTITDAIQNDPETDVKKRAVFALSQLPKDEGIPLLITVARTNANPAVKKQAIFWLGQSKDPRALRFFEEILFK